MFLMLVMVQKRSWSLVHSTFVISQIRLGSCFVLAVCRVCTRKNFMRILCYVQFVTSEVLNKSTFALEMFSTVRTQNLFSNVLFVNSLFYYVNVCSCASIETQFHRSVWYFITASEIFLQRQRFKPSFWNFNVASEIFCSVWDMYCRKKTAPPKNAPLSLHDRDRGGYEGFFRKNRGPIAINGLFGLKSGFLGQTTSLLLKKSYWFIKKTPTSHKKTHYGNNRDPVPCISHFGVVYVATNVFLVHFLLFGKMQKRAFLHNSGWDRLRSHFGLFFGDLNDPTKFRWSRTKIWVLSQKDNFLSLSVSRIERELGDPK